MEDEENKKEERTVFIAAGDAVSNRAPIQKHGRILNGGEERLMECDQVS